MTWGDRAFDLLSNGTVGVLLGRPVARAMAVFVFHVRIVVWGPEAKENSVCYRLVSSTSSGTARGSSYCCFRVLW